MIQIKNYYFLIKKYSIIGIVSILFFCKLSCSNFPAGFEQIEKNKVRTLDFIYQNTLDTTLCEASPGDSVRLIAIFSGKKIENVEWNVSYDIITTLYGVDKVLDCLPLSYNLLKSTIQDTSSKPADTIALSFEIPESVIRNNTMIQKQWYAHLPQNLISTLPENLKSLNKNELLDNIEYFSKMGCLWDSLISEKSDKLDSLLKMPGKSGELFNQYHKEFKPCANQIIQSLSAKIRLKAIVNNEYIIYSYMTVRFNRLFSYMPNNIFVNKNPQITTIGLYQVHQDNLAFFDPAIHTQKYDSIILFSSIGDIVSDTILFDNGKSYFLFTNSNMPDTSKTFFGTLGVEKHRYEWFFALSKQEVAGIDYTYQMKIDNTNKLSIATLSPPKTNAIKSVILWVQVNDMFSNERLRPSGSSIVEKEIFFKYTLAYLNKYKNSKE